MKHAPIPCSVCRHREAICNPVICIPLKNYPTPAYVGSKKDLCQQCANAFTLDVFNRESRDWYESICDGIRSNKKPSKNPFPDDPSFKFESWILDPDWHPAKKEECFVQFWKIKRDEITGKPMEIKSMREGLPLFRPIGGWNR